MIRPRLRRVDDIRSIFVGGSSMRDESRAADLESIHKFCTRNRELLSRSDSAGCFYCLEIYPPAEIQDWVDGLQVETGSLADGVTALCARCGIDAVLPSAAPIPLTEETLRAMHAYWFERTVFIESETP
jgi:hypothetical protein